MRTISYAGVELVFKPRWKIHGILVPVEGDTLPDILKHLRAKLSQGAVPDPDSKKKARRKEALENRDDEDAGRIRWLHPDHAYQVHYTDAKGTKHVCSKHFKVARVDAMGKMLDAELYKASRAQVLRKARAWWNREDKTAMERYANVEDNDSCSEA